MSQITKSFETIKKFHKKTNKNKKELTIDEIINEWEQTVMDKRIIFVKKCFNIEEELFKNNEDLKKFFD